MEILSKRKPDMAILNMEQSRLESKKYYYRERWSFHNV